MALLPKAQRTVTEPEVDEVNQNGSQYTVTESASAQNGPTDADKAMAMSRAKGVVPRPAKKASKDTDPALNVTSENSPGYAGEMEPVTFTPVSDAEKQQIARSMTTDSMPGADDEVSQGILRQGAGTRAMREDDWGSGKSFGEIARNSNMTISEALESYRAYQRTHPDAPQLDLMDFWAFQGMDPNKSVAENKKDIEKEKAKEKAEKINNVLMHFANLYNTAVSGAPAMDLEQAPQLTERQMKRMQTVKAMRQQDWQNLLAMWKQDQANQLAKQKAQRDADKAAADQDYKRQMLDIKIKEATAKGDKAALDAAYLEAKLEGKRSQNEADKKLWAAKEQQILATARYMDERSRGGSRGGGGKPTYETTTTTEVSTKDGVKKTTKTEKKEVAGTNARREAQKKQNHKNNPFG